MKPLDFSIAINAPREKVWNILWNDSTYPQWTSPFSPDSRVVTDWKKGSRALFTDGSNCGMIALVEENIPNEFMSLRHIGVLNDGKEDLTAPEKEGWANAHENYTLNARNGGTELRIHMDTIEKHEDFMSDAWPKALEKVKALAEKK